jgi:hypothetical protein
MQYLRTASFGGLFAVTFTVAATCQVILSLLGLIAVAAAPGIFKMNGAPATNPLEAFGVLVFLVIFCLFINAGMSALGSAFWLVARRLLPRPKVVAT